jgi:hypothetical protein
MNKYRDKEPKKFKVLTASLIRKVESAFSTEIRGGRQGKDPEFEAGHLPPKECPNY